MHFAARVSAFAALLACSTGAPCQQPATSWVSAEWTPVTDENTRVYQAVDAKFRSDVEADYQKRVAEAKARPRARNGSSTLGAPTGSEPSGPIPEGMRGPGAPRGNARIPDPPTVTSLVQLLPADLDFAAPPSGGLIVQRMSGAVVFGRTDSEALVMIPLSGEADLPHGMRGSIREEGGQLRMNVQMASGQAVEYRYRLDPDPSGRVMSVDIHIPNALPGASVDLRRQYRRAQVNVGELKKAGQ